MLANTWEVNRLSVFGWRWWNLAKDTSLQSVNNDLWPPNDPLRAECKYGNAGSHADPAPSYDCHCGLWAFSDPEIASALPSVGYFRVVKVFGIIEAWGNIVWHENGFRAEWAIPRAVVVLRGRLHPAYEVDRYPSIEKMLKVWDLGGGADDPFLNLNS